MLYVHMGDGFDAARARALGFKGESDFREIIRIYIEDDLRR